MKRVLFLTSECGNDANEAFCRAVNLAQSNHGCKSNTGTIADKKEFKMVKREDKSNPFDWARQHLELDTVKTVNDTVSCIDAGEGEFIFFGYAFKNGMNAESEEEL